MEENMRKLPVDRCDLEGLINEHYVYIDKTELVWRLVNGNARYVYLSRPKRFGKSMVLDTLAHYFAGHADLFEGLALGRLMQGREWVARPVIRLDLSNCVGKLDNFSSCFGKQLRRYERALGLTPGPNDGPAERFADILQEYSLQGSPKVAVLIDEYDAPLVEQYVNRKTGLTDHLDELIELYRPLFMNLKSMAASIEFLYITGCTRFNGLNLFSALNNIQNISIAPEYATLCGFTERELRDNFAPELARMAQWRDESVEETVAYLREQFDGYRFSCNEGVEKVYNPFSLVNALSAAQNDSTLARNVAYYWSAPSSVSALASIWNVDFETLLRTEQGLVLTTHDLVQGDISRDNKALLLYQAGFLTLQSTQDGIFQLCYPNLEVRTVLVDVVLPQLLRLTRDEWDHEWERWRQAALAGAVEEALWSLRLLLSKAPHGAEDYNGAAPEQRATLLTTYICWASRFRVAVEPKQAYGEPDRVITAGDWVYVVEFKRPATGGLAAAWRQMKEGRYVEPHIGAARRGGRQRRVVALAILVRDDGRGICGFRARTYHLDGEHLAYDGEQTAQPRWKELEEMD